MKGRARKRQACCDLHLNAVEHNQQFRQVKPVAVAFFCLHILSLLHQIYQLPSPLRTKAISRSITFLQHWRSIKSLLFKHSLASDAAMTRTMAANPTGPSDILSYLLRMSKTTFMLNRFHASCRLIFMVIWQLMLTMVQHQDLPAIPLALADPPP